MNETEETPEKKDNFGVLLAKTTVASAATTAGILLGAAVAGATLNAVKTLKAKRRAKKEAAQAE